MTQMFLGIQSTKLVQNCLSVANIAVRGSVSVSNAYIGKSTVKKKNYKADFVNNLSQCMRFPTMWYVRPAKPQISLRIRAV